MDERRVTAEELVRRIDQLLNVLNIIMRDLAEISKSLKATSPEVAAVPERLHAIEDVQMLFPKDLQDMLTFEETRQYIVIKPRRYLGSENFARIASIVRDSGGEYISAGKESHFRVPREME